MEVRGEDRQEFRCVVLAGQQVVGGFDRDPQSLSHMFVDHVEETAPRF